jgi:hypothetical protein
MCVNWKRVQQSPTAYTLGLEVRRWSSTPTLLRVSKVTPACSSPMPSTLGLRPVAMSSASPSKHTSSKPSPPSSSSAPPPGSPPTPLATAGPSAAALAAARACTRHPRRARNGRPPLAAPSLPATAF